HVNVGYELQNVDEEDEEEEEEGIEGIAEMELETNDEGVGGRTKWTNTFFYNLALFLRVIPERLLIGAELNSGHDFIKDGITNNEVILVPEFIAIPFEKPIISVKCGVPIGSTNDDDNVDWGISAGLSFQF
ncbi:hypothetical protein MYX76_15190, partial [Desulfobacterota bacterium AH_259_B03_O07]|nr:hypothetical protein [Desulfobacterota bacterium AH_259_B03_O07]